MYNKALCIELHNSHIVISDKNNLIENDVALMGRPEFAFRKAYTINLGDIKKIAIMLGLDTVDKWPSNKPRGEKYEYADYIDFPIMQDYRSFPDNSEIIELLECEILNPLMVNIKITTRYPPEEAEYKTLITYSGNFTIWWDEIKEE
jgi:hypothetical protein